MELKSYYMAPAPWEHALFVSAKSAVFNNNLCFSIICVLPFLITEKEIMYETAYTWYTNPTALLLLRNHLTKITTCTFPDSCILFYINGE